MDMAEPVSYWFPPFAHRRPMDSPLFSYYSHPATAPYSLPYETPASAACSYEPLNQLSHPYQYFVSHHPLPPSVRLRSDQPSHSLPEIRPAKNAINDVGKPENYPNGPLPGSQTVSSDHLAKRRRKNSASGNDFSTEVDILMKAIQSKANSISSSSSSPAPPQQQQQQQSLPLPQHLAASGYPSYLMPPSRCATNEGQLSRSGKTRRYTCTLPDCGKSFAQKTHLDIHTRAHTGDKPFVCKEPSCGQRFSQLGNLKTHQRRHTGEKPFACDICHKRFAQRGNVRAHKITHLHAKPFACLLDECGKKFTQLGNLKSHQNKFHAATLRTLTIRFSETGNNGPVNPQDRELWEYFATLYRNSNKGIKGRGKDRRITTVDPSAGAEFLHRTPSSLGSDGDEHGRSGSFDDGFSAYGGGSSNGENPRPFFVDRRGH